MSVLIRTVVALPLLVFLSIVGWMLFIVLDPIMAEVLASEAADNVGFLDPVTTVVRLGVRFVLPGIALAIAVWWIFGAIRTDTHHRHRGGGRY
ncbi:hypothetical protein [Natrarchaeobaculum sulfurireducens]|uniref:Uncharacterized protein n=1 Tax=Natrarchaeobaculum sulfurireducens TaxID=2044521 RepID=A0A346PMG6_9EURY|nr:hypothetical protein [Natrarchaeobaculum sulfurireducens]AXR80711.1 hypothetical protein AArcMg_0689 [Natrarchaeobaculum sulfurireducens]